MNPFKSLLLSCLLLPVFAIAQNTAPAINPEEQSRYWPKKTQEPKKPKKVITYPYGYNSTELSSVPMRKISGWHNPELIEEYRAWLSYLAQLCGIWKEIRKQPGYFYINICPH